MTVYHPKPGSPLTDRQVQVLRLVADGLTTRQIAARLFYTTGTVFSHIWAACVKLGVHDRVAAVRVARERGELDG